MNSPKLFVLSSVAGGGKSTLIQKLREKHPEILFSISCTTRAPRPGDKEGVTYFFLSKEEFEKGISDSAFLEWALVHDQYYGTPLKFIEEAFAKGSSVIMDIDVQGAKIIKEKLPGKIVTIFILPPSEEEWERRLRGRGTDSEENILKRIRNGKAELERQNEFDYKIVNDRLEKALEELEAIILGGSTSKGKES
ncbi:guanylate kinase [Leptospira kmetyi]|uniref:guanylate kinase n=1 Tax=Leptospira kmetyi TaxID=408139 RepID=UPI000A051E66|nr:guanylate kinase [Leptospira kmetyi]PJZ42591.1 guanylate kinase [Leptospira kmetyi]TGK13679.1 guanylate kinase [Leptospira kmetyi]TGK29164.1 guanylate kinase [Leptospira kmetyi]TGL71855.1 guanylate kinase [Leptospira kmetyi]